MQRPLRKKGAIMAHSGGTPKHLGPAVDMSRHSQCLYKSRGTAGVMQSLWSHQNTAGENSGTWRRPETGKGWASRMHFTGSAYGKMNSWRLQGKGPTLETRGLPREGARCWEFLGQTPKVKQHCQAEVGSDCAVWICIRASELL